MQNKSTLEIHAEAESVAKQAGEQYIAEHGEPFYCGFAWVNIAPGTSKFARELKKHGVVRGRSYYGGVDVWNPGGIPTQSMDVKEIAADAYVKVLGNYGIRATMMSRAD
tara:strand:+ start:380 stop:706 length:327 start_codon:yes stop_codon:yes gene_type:complete